MSAASPLDTAGIDLDSAMSFVWREADLLDAREYDEWLRLWTPEGRYVIPIDRDAIDHAATLNVVYDDAAMRAARVKRLRGGYSMSATAAARTVRISSRFRLLSVDASSCTLRCAQHLAEHRRDRTVLLAADVVYRLVRDGEDLRMDEKVVRLVNSDEALHGMGYLL